MFELNIKTTPTIAYENNSGALDLANNGKFTKNLKHIDISYHLVQDYMNKGQILVKKIQTADQQADILTRSLSSSRFFKLGNFLNLK